LTKGAFTEKILAKRNDMSEIIDWDFDFELTDKNCELSLLQQNLFENRSKII